MFITTTSDTSTSQGEEVENWKANPMDQPKHARARPPLCQARRKDGSLCRAYPLRGRKRCRSHGGRAGAPKAEANGAYRHGAFTEEAIALKRDAAQLLRDIRSTARDAGAEVDMDPTMRMLLELLQGKRTRAEKRERNRSEWATGDRTRWGGQNRRGWQKRGRTNRYLRMQR